MLSSNFGTKWSRLRLRLRISRGNSYELNNQSLLSRTLYISDEETDVLIKGYRAVLEKLDSMIKSIEKKDPLTCEGCNIKMALVFVCFTYQQKMTKKLGLKPDEVIPSRQIKIDTS